MSCGDLVFKRPHPTRVNDPTPHLFVGNCGPKLGFTDSDVRSIFQPFVSGSGELLVHVPDGELSSHVYVSFSTAAEAAAAAQALSGRPCEAAHGRVLMVKFAELEQPKQVRSLLQDTNSSSYCCSSLVSCTQGYRAMHRLVPICSNSENRWYESEVGCSGVTSITASDNGVRSARNMQHHLLQVSKQQQ
jgi:hypothetical protein